jgi:hypothetical protein
VLNRHIPQRGQPRSRSGDVESRRVARVDLVELAGEDGSDVTGPRADIVGEGVATVVGGVVGPDEGVEGALRVVGAAREVGVPVEGGAAFEDGWVNWSGRPLRGGLVVRWGEDGFLWLGFAGLELGRRICAAICTVLILVPAR